MTLSLSLAIGFFMAAAIALSSVFAQRTRLANSIMLLVVGAGLAFVPHLPRVILNPEVVLMLLLPPLLYSSGVGMSWPGFKKNLTPIMLLAIGCVLFTASAVALAMHLLFGLPWALGFVLGAVVSPPDAVAPMAIARRLAIPRRILTILEGEGLVNDATALILFTFALAAVENGGISLVDASIKFVLVVVLELAFGIFIGWLSLRLRALAKNTEVEIMLALLAPFAAFWPPHDLGGSGVLATVAAGLYVSWNGPAMIPPATRLQGFFVWGLVVYVIEGIVFLITGLQSRAVFEGPDADEWHRMAFGSLVTIGVVIAVRFIWVFSGSYLPSLLARSGKPVAKPHWKSVFVIAFTGIRGGVSLVAALSIPETLGNAEFPERDLILVVTFCVIIVTLVGQGTTLPALVRALKLDREGQAEADRNRRLEIAARVVGIDAALERLDQLEGEHAPASAVASLRRYHTDRRIDFVQTGDDSINGAPAADTAVLQSKLVEAERGAIARVYRAGKLTDDARRRIERELDLEDARLHHAAQSATGSSIEDIADEESG